MKEKNRIPARLTIFSVTKLPTIGHLENVVITKNYHIDHLTHPGSHCCGLEKLGISSSGNFQNPAFPQTLINLHTPGRNDSLKYYKTSLMEPTISFPVSSRIL